MYKKYFKKYKLPFVAAIFCVGFEAICDLLGPTLMSNIINLGIEQGSISKVYHFGFLMLLTTFVGACFAITRNILASKVSQRVGADLRYDLFEKIVHFSEKSSDKIESGSLITRMTNDTSQVVQFVNGIMRIFMKAPITCVGSIVLASILNFRLSFIIYGIVVVVGLLIVFSMKLSYPRYYKLQKAMDNVNLVVQEYLIGIRLVKAFGTYSKEKSKFEDANNNLMKNGVSSQMIITLISPFMTLVVGFGTVLVIFVGSKMFSMQIASPGDITAFTIYMAQILTSLVMITNIFNVFVRTKASTMRIKEVFDCEVDFSGSGDSRCFNLGGDVKFENVTFAYPSGSKRPSVSNVSFEVKSGESLAIIGPTGSGKSTIAWLLLRFYDVDSGRILVGGYDVCELDVRLLRDSVSLVPQKAMLFSGSVKDNIMWGNRFVSEDEVIDVINNSCANFVYDMDKGVDSLLSSGGVNVSGGQKQRISIARALIKNSSILVLDDATSALDAVTEARVRDNMSSNNSQTVITITQRISTAMHADNILVVDNGCVVGYGCHDVLMRDCEIYRDIYSTQVESSKEV